MRISDWSSDVCSSDLDYAEDSTAAADANFVLTAAGGVVEVQGTAEDVPFSRQQFEALLNLAEKGVKELCAHQAKVLGPARSEERRVGKEWFSTCRDRWSPVH